MSQPFAPRPLIIAPSILASDFSRLGEEVRAVGKDELRPAVLKNRADVVLLDRRLPQHMVFEEQTWRERCVGAACVGMDRHPSRIEIETDDAAANAGPLPLAILVTCRHEGEFAPEVSQRGTGQTTDQRPTLLADALFVDEQ